MKLLSYVRKNGFVLLLVVAFLLIDVFVARLDPMTNSRRFEKDDFTKTLFHHQWDRSGPVFFGNSAVTGAYMEDKAQLPLVEMGMSYGKITDLRAIMKRGLYDFQEQLVIGIDVHTMLDRMQTDPRFPWSRPWYSPYIFHYRDYFQDAGGEWIRNAWAGLLRRELDFGTYEPRWIDKELYFGREPAEQLKKDWERYEANYSWMQLGDMADNLDALDWVIRYANDRALPLKVVWMPLNPDTAYPQPAYWKQLKERVGGTLQSNGIPVLDLSDVFKPDEFHDLVHLNRETGAPKFTSEVDRWLRSFEKSGK
ncbi:hypothetical protein FE784_25585 [Paenibacillus hemerocallicola]|uniref:SGNH/GDSL hydrolase family protein n=1 Tax=Paenibacillus hemerocallicola TaxID=1172614 RepID=A0A5C4T5E1_9BACL|nr:hypothetical protein [Paenibacillus hemerocallicola]TNJ63419.1 hypothetical protein FE784_25585 [Paenibacillus hemerocallicola]